MKYLPSLILAELLLASGALFAQPTPDELLVVGHGGEVSLLSPGNPGATPPVVLLNGEIVHAGGVDCGQTPNRPQCQTLAWLQGTGGQQTPGYVIVNTGYGGGATFIIDTFPNGYPPPIVVVDGCIINSGSTIEQCPFWQEGPPLIVEVAPGDGATLHSDAGPSTYPPPAVVIDGEWINRPPDYDHVQAIAPNGDLVVLHGGQGDAEMPIVLLGGEVLQPGGADCNLDASHPQCLSLNIVYENEGAGLQEAPGIVAIWTGTSEVVLYDVNVSDYPPPVVIVDGVVINRSD
ncbi:MAG: hypothetical protein R3348_09215 [Xanthomonadales bacterium]|nr:hypothetical protein [Xanthomonadales bacterium]